MAYDFTKEIQEVVEDFERGGKGSVVRVTRIVNSENGNEFLDVRTMYTDAAGDIKPTAKGIRLPKELATEVIVAMIKGLGENGVELIKDLGVL